MRCFCVAFTLEMERAILQPACEGPRQVGVWSGGEGRGWFLYTASTPSVEPWDGPDLCGMATTGGKTCKSLVRRAPSSCCPRHPVSPPRGRGLTLQHGMALSLLPSRLVPATESLSCQAGRGTAEPCGTETRTVRLSSRPRRGSGSVSPSRSVLLSKWDKKGAEVRR